VGQTPSAKALHDKWFCRRKRSGFIRERGGTSPAQEGVIQNSGRLNELAKNRIKTLTGANRASLAAIGNSMGVHGGGEGGRFVVQGRGGYDEDAERKG